MLQAAADDDAAPARRAYLRNRILHDHLVSLSLNSQEKARTDVANGLTFLSATTLVGGDEKYPESGPATDAPSRIYRAGGLSTDDLKRFSAMQSPITPQSEELLVAEMKKTLLSIRELYTGSDENDNDDEQLEFARRLPTQIREQRGRIAQEQSASRERRGRILRLLQEVNEVHPRLEEQLIAAVTTLPPLLNERRTAQADLLAVTIETCLVKLALTRARAQAALYGHTPAGPKSSKSPDSERPMHSALAAAQESLMERLRAQQEEEGALDEQIAAYESALGLAGGGYAQIVEDMARVRRETEECRTDLRRLGWTGD